MEPTGYGVTKQSADMTGLRPYTPGSLQLLLAVNWPSNYVFSTTQLQPEYGFQQLSGAYPGATAYTDIRSATFAVAPAVPTVPEPP